MTSLRAVLIALGAAIGAYGASLLLQLGGHNLIETLKWLIGGVLLHDGLIGPAVIVVAVVAGRLARGKAPAPLIVGAVVLATVTVVAVPVLGRFGHRPDNATLLDRSYGVGWLVFAGLTLLLVALSLVASSVASARRSHRPADSEGGGDGTGPGRG